MMHRLTFDFVLWGSRSNVGSWNGIAARKRLGTTGLEEWPNEILIK